MRFRSKERGTRVKDHAKNGASERAGRGWGRKEGNQKRNPKTRISALFRRRTTLGSTQEGHARRSEGESTTKNYLEKDCRERAKQSRVEEPRGRAGKYPKRLHETESVGQTAWRPYEATRHDDGDDDDDDDVEVHRDSWEGTKEKYACLHESGKAFLAGNLDPELFCT